MSMNPKEAKKMTMKMMKLTLIAACVLQLTACAGGIGAQRQGKLWQYNDDGYVPAAGICCDRGLEDY